MFRPLLLDVTDSIMDQAKQSLDQFYRLMANPELYPDVSSAWLFLYFFIRLFSFALGLAGIILVLLTIARLVVDVLVIYFAGFSDSSSFVSKMKRFSSFRGDGAEVPADLWTYVKRHWFRAALGLSLAVLLISGQMMPLVGRITYALQTTLYAILRIDLDLDRTTENITNQNR